MREDSAIRESGLGTAEVGCRGLLHSPSRRAPTLASAQNCALCYTQAAGSGSRMIHALKSGILILMIPPMGICIGLAVMAYKKRNQFNDDYESQP